MRTGGGHGSATVTIVSFMPSAWAQAAATGSPRSEAGVPSTQATRWSTSSGGDRRLVLGVRVDDGGAGDDDGLAAAFDDVARRRSDDACRRPVLARASTGRPGTSRGRAAQRWTARGDVGVDLDVDARVVGVGAERAAPLRARMRSSSKSETATVTVWIVASNRAASARAVGSAPSAKCEPSSGTRIVAVGGVGGSMRGGVHGSAFVESERDRAPAPPVR